MEQGKEEMKSRHRHFVQILTDGGLKRLVSVCVCVRVDFVAVEQLSTSFRPCSCPDIRVNPQALSLDLQIGDEYDRQAW